MPLEPVILHPESITHPESLKAQPSGIAHKPKLTPSGMTTQVSTKSFSQIGLGLICAEILVHENRQSIRPKKSVLFMIYFCNTLKTAFFTAAITSCTCSSVKLK